RDLPFATVILNTFGKRLIWIPQEDVAAFKSQSQTEDSYGEWMGTWGYELTPPTLGQVLASCIYGTTTFALPSCRWAGIEFEKVPDLEWEVRQAIPSLIDIVIVTENHIAVVAVPRD